MGYYNSFIVRIWLDEDGLSRGRIEHTRTHDDLVFTDLPAIVEFIRIHVALPPPCVPSSGGERDEERNADNWTVVGPCIKEFSMSDATCRLRDSGSWNGSAHWEGEGGQLMRFTVNNANILGTTITIASTNTNQSESRIIPPAGSAEIEFTSFGAEPMYWPFDISTDSDAFIVTWELCSSWVPGDPPNG